MSGDPDLTGMVYGFLTVVEKATPPFWIVECSCGIRKSVRAGNLKNGGTLSCGCWRKDRLLKHGCRVDVKKTPPEYNSWVLMRDRCNNPNNKTYSYYGGRGIKVCKRWNNYGVFLSDMGPQPKGFSLDRINPDLGYKPSNCRWASKTRQSRNRRDSIMLTYKGVTKQLNDWAEHLGMPYTTLKYRYYAGKPTEEILRKGAKYA